jgi:hypothetical protein
MESIKNIRALNRKARKYLLEHCVSRRAAEVIAHDFTGYINSNYYENVSLIRKNGKWRLFGQYFDGYINGLGGEFDGFSMTRNTILS